MDALIVELTAAAVAAYNRNDVATVVIIASVLAGFGYALVITEWVTDDDDKSSKVCRREN